MTKLFACMVFGTDTTGQINPERKCKERHFLRKPASEAITQIYTKELIAAMICAAQNGVFRFSIQEKTDGIETVRLLAQCSPQLKQIVKVAYHTGMRQGEIINLTWGQVDLKEGFIRLHPEDTKTNEGRLVPLTGELVGMFKAMPRGLPEVNVFTFKGRSITNIKVGFVKACKRADIEDFTFHDLRHTAINNWRLAGHDYFRIMAASGHKTMSVFKRYNTVSKKELQTLVNGNSG
jgi:integrase